MQKISLLRILFFIFTAVTLGYGFVLYIGITSGVPVDTLIYAAIPVYSSFSFAVYWLINSLKKE